MVGRRDGDDESDPVQRAFDSDDLYDIASWTNRTRVDHVAVRVHSFLRGSATYVLIALAVLLFLVQLAATGFVLFDRPELGILVLLSAIPAYILAMFLWHEDVTAPEPMKTLAVTFLLGALFSGFAAVVNTVLELGFSQIPVVGMVLFFYLVVGPVEETVKWLSVRVHAYGTDHFNAVVDGAVYGAFAGLGFATIENTLYITQAFLSAQSGASHQIGTALATATQRSFVGPGHVIYAGFSGYYLGLAKFNHENAGPIVVKGLLIAAFIHATYDTLVTYLPFSSLSFAAFVVLYDGLFGYLLYRKLARYRAKYVEAAEMPAGSD